MDLQHAAPQRIQRRKQLLGQLVDQVSSRSLRQISRPSTPIVRTERPVKLRRDDRHPQERVLATKAIGSRTFDRRRTGRHLQPPASALQSG